MPASEEQKRQAEARRTKVADLWLRCVSLADIARRTGVHRSQITRDLQTIRREWRQARPEKFEERLLDELGRLDRLECTYWDAWDRSMKDAEVRTAKASSGPTGDRSESSERREGQAGDPRFLEGVRWCIDRRIELLGLDPPKRLAVGGDPEGAPLEILNFEVVSPVVTDAGAA